MALVSIDLLKAHVRADDFEADDQLLAFYLEAAEDYVVKATNRPLQEIIKLGEGRFPRDLVQAVLLIAAHWYNQREAVGTANQTETPYTVSALIKPWRAF